jgi:hypothetical protein
MGETSSISISAVSATATIRVLVSKFGVFEVGNPVSAGKRHMWACDLCRPLGIQRNLLKTALAEEVTSVICIADDLPNASSCTLVPSNQRRSLHLQEGIDGHVTDVDLWDAKDQSQSSAAAALENARKEDVSKYVEVRTADARELPSPDASFDLVVSSLCIHNIGEGLGR